MCTCVGRGTGNQWGHGGPCSNGGGSSGRKAKGREAGPGLGGWLSEGFPGRGCGHGTEACPTHSLREQPGEKCPDFTLLPKAALSQDPRPWNPPEARGRAVRDAVCGAQPARAQGTDVEGGVTAAPRTAPCFGPGTLSSLLVCRVK